MKPIISAVGTLERAKAAASRRAGVLSRASEPGAVNIIILGGVPVVNDIACLRLKSNMK